MLVAGGLRRVCRISYQEVDVEFSLDDSIDEFSHLKQNTNKLRRIYGIMYRDSPCGLRVEAAPSGAGPGQIWPYTGISEQLHRLARPDEAQATPRT